MFAMVRAVVPEEGPRWCCMVQIAQVYKDQRVDIMVDRGDIVFDRLRPWQLLVVKGRKLQLAPFGCPPDSGFVVDEAITAVDEFGKDVGDVPEYKKTLFDVTLQTLKEKTSVSDLMRMQVSTEDPSSFFEHLMSLWHARTPQYEMMEHAVRFLRAARVGGKLGALAVERATCMAADLLEYLQLKSQVSKVDPGLQVSHVPIDGLCMRRVRSTDEFMELWRRAMRLRVQASTSNNEASSRSAVTVKLNLVWPHAAYASAAGRIGSVGSYALSSLVVDDLPGAESAADFDPSDPDYHVRVSETMDIGSDLLKLGLLLGRRTSPSGRKITEDIRCVDDKQAVVAILLCGKLHHKDLAPTLRFGHHAGRALVTSMRQKQVTAWLQDSRLDLATLGIAQLLDFVRSEALCAGLSSEEAYDVAYRLEGALRRARTTDEDLVQKLRTSTAVFTVLQDIMGSRAAEVAVERRRAEVLADERREERLFAAESEAARLADARMRARQRARSKKEFEERFASASKRSEMAQNTAVKQAKAFLRSLQSVIDVGDDLRSLEQDLVNLRSSAPEDLPEMSFGVEDLRLLQETSVVVPCLSDLAQVAAEVLSLRDTDIAQRIS